jgi:hypothetical protein
MHAASVLKVSMEFHSGFPSPRSSDQSTHSTISKTYRQRIRFALPLVELIPPSRIYTIVWMAETLRSHGCRNRHLRRDSVVPWPSIYNAPVPGVTVMWQIWSPSERPRYSVGDQWTVPELWLSACVGGGSRGTSYSPICLTGFPFDLFPLADV